MGISSDEQSRILDLDKVINKQYLEIKRLREEKQGLVTAMDINQKDHQKYIETENQLSNTIRQITQLDKKFERSINLVEETRNVINKNSDQSGIQSRIMEIREQVQLEKERVKLVEKENKFEQVKTKKGFDKVQKLHSESRALKKEIQFLKGSQAPVYMDNNMISQMAEKSHTNKAKKKFDKDDQKKLAIDAIKRKHGELMMRDKTH